MLRTFKNWKRGAFVCAIIGVAAFLGYFVALLLLMPIVLMAPYISGISLEDQWEDIAVLVCIITVPLYVNFFEKSGAFVLEVH